MSSKKKRKPQLECWRCGASLAQVPRPITRFSECLSCRADLHICRMCRFFAPQLIGQCSHERAERISDKELANFCTHFRPRPEAHSASIESSASESRAELDALFGSSSDAPAGAAERVRSAADKAREELDALFGRPDKDASD